MDLRIQKTKTSIINAFIELRATKPIEKITITELSKLAMINKATFYKHYRDIYDLSESLEDEIIASILKSVPEPEKLLSDPYDLSKDIFRATLSQSQLIHTLFSGSRESYLIQKLDKQIKEVLFKKCPQYQNDLELKLQLTVLIQGGFHAFLEHGRIEQDRAIDILSRISECVIKNFK
ncbi:MAG: TetR/AcrR family transcriptional regulator [Lachnospiraceae bacterium]|nr:TetR/AcrR family transcriptional regulator [Lachnospiraceae bacterium]